MNVPANSGRPVGVSACVFVCVSVRPVVPAPPDLPGLSTILQQQILSAFLQLGCVWLCAGTITSSSPTAQPAEVLLQATPPHRRARSAAWSYIFLPEEAWCDLTIHLPAAVLLKEIHIQPHLASLAST